MYCILLFDLNIFMYFPVLTVKMVEIIQNDWEKKVILEQIHKYHDILNIINCLKKNKKSP